MALVIFSGCTEKSEITIKSDTVLPTGVSGQSYSAPALEATGGTPPYKWTLKPGSIMPDGLKLAENGVIFGTAPVLTGGTTIRITPPFTVTVTDSAGQQQDLEARITIDISPPTLTLKSGTCTVGKYSSIPLIAQVSGGNPPYSYQSDTFMSGTPPMGMIVDINGNLVGTPAKEGQYTFGVCAIDMGGRSSCKQTTVTVEEDKVASLAGTWTGSYSHTSTGDGGCTYNNRGTLKMTVTATGSSFSGSAWSDGIELRWTSDCRFAKYTSSSGTFSGTLTGDSMDVSFNFPVAETGGSIHYHGTATLSNNTIKGTFMSKTTGETYGTFTLTRQ